MCGTIVANIPFQFFGSVSSWPTWVFFWVTSVTNRHKLHQFVLPGMDGGRKPAKVPGKSGRPGVIQTPDDTWPLEIARTCFPCGLAVLVRESGRERPKKYIDRRHLPAQTTWLTLRMQCSLWSSACSKQTVSVSLLKRFLILSSLQGRKCSPPRQKNAQRN